MDNATRFPQLRTMPLLMGLSEDVSTVFLNKCTARNIGVETQILTQDEHPDSAIIVAKGSAEISYTSVAGHRAIIAVAVPGDALGLIEVIAKRPCAATCTASPETELLYCSPQLLREFVGHETFLRNYARIAYDMLAHDNTFKAIDQFYTAEQKICSYLIKFAEPSGTFTQNQSYLANAAGCTRQTVNKELSYLREHDIIQIERNEISILDAARLQERIGDLDSRKAKKL